jgi:phosphoribosylformylglycinamidine cyclo-ligase
MKKATYKDAGVDLDTYAQSMERLPKLVSKTFSPGVLKLDGGFAGLFRLFEKGEERKEYKDPVLVSCTDGVGTKLKIATMADRHDTIGIDLVAMSVNDAICCGADPLFFLDYVAMDRDDPPRLESIVEGIVRGCEMANCALLGGETAIMPDLYRPGEYDLAGFCVGVAEKQRVIDGKQIRVGDQLLGIASSGLHSNGYSLVRKIVFEMAQLGLEDPVAGTGMNVGELLLTPTTIYVPPVKALLAEFEANREVTGIAHITGGGLRENMMRIFPETVRPEIVAGSWPVPKVFSWLQKLGNVDPNEMERVFNGGIGLVLVVRPEVGERALEIINQSGYPSYHLGCVVSRES